MERLSMDDIFTVNAEGYYSDALSEVSFVRPNIIDDRYAEDISVLCERLAEEWKQGCRYTSSFDELIAHPAHQKIIELGQSALPFIFTDLRGSNPKAWFFALRKITGATNVIPEQDAGNFDKMKTAWLNWAETHGY